MHQMVVVILSGVMLLLCGEIRATGLFDREPEIEIQCSNGALEKGYSRLSRLTPNAGFTYSLITEPVPNEEWEPKEPIVLWSLNPQPTGGRFVSMEEKAEMRLSPDTSFGVSYTINLLLTWPLENKETGEIKRESRSSSYVVDAVDYSFRMGRLLGKGASGGLLDNYPAIVNVTTKGCTRTNLLDLSFTSHPNPKEGGTPVNKAGTAMKFFRESALVFTVEKTYWYGLNKPNCCYRNRFPYEVKLFERRDGLVATEEVTVGWPDEHPKAEVRWSDPEYSIVIEKSGDRYKATVNLGDFKAKVIPCNGDSVTDQYKEETLKEEEYHTKQLTGKVSWEEGGEPNLFSVAKIRANLLSDENCKTVELYSEDKEAYEYFNARISQCVKDAIRDEKLISRVVINANQWYYELKAKKYAGYNAAWMYHCTYEDDEHPESDVEHMTREQFEKMWGK